MSDLQSNWGRDKVFRVTVVDQGARVDLTGRTVRFTAKLRRTDADPPLVTKTTGGSGIVLLDQTQAATKGQADITILAADTKVGRLHPGRENVLEWDLELDSGAGADFLVDSGTWIVEPSVRRT